MRVDVYHPQHGWPVQRIFRNEPRLTSVARPSTCCSYAKWRWWHVWSWPASSNRPLKQILPRCLFRFSWVYVKNSFMAKKGSLMVKWILEDSWVGFISPRFKSDVNYAACSLIMPIATGALISSVSSCPSHPPFQVSFQLVAFPAFLLRGFKESTSRLLRWSSSFQLSPSSSPSHPPRNCAGFRAFKSLELYQL